MAGTPILSNIESNMKSMVEAMSVSGGQNFEWGTVNQRDLVQTNLFDSDDNAVAFIELDPEETNLDEPDGVHAGAYLNECFFKITSITRLVTESDNPTFDNNDLLNKMLDDLKQLFGTDHSVNGTADVIMYSRAVRVPKLAGDIFIPSILESFWRVRYTQDRQTPTQPDP